MKKCHSAQLKRESFNVDTYILFIFEIIKIYSTNEIWEFLENILLNFSMAGGVGSFIFPIIHSCLALSV